jgi:hypothetical protein
MKISHDDNFCFPLRFCRIMVAWLSHWTTATATASASASASGIENWWIGKKGDWIPVKFNWYQNHKDWNPKDIDWQKKISLEFWRKEIICIEQRSYLAENGQYCEAKKIEKSMLMFICRPIASWCDVHSIPYQCYIMWTKLECHLATNSSFAKLLPFFCPQRIKTRNTYQSTRSRSSVPDLGSRKRRVAGWWDYHGFMRIWDWFSWSCSYTDTIYGFSNQNLRIRWANSVDGRYWLIWKSNHIWKS